MAEGKEMGKTKMANEFTFEENVCMYLRNSNSVLKTEHLDVEGEEEKEEAGRKVSEGGEGGNGQSCHKVRNCL